MQEDSVAGWIQLLKAGEAEAAERLWERYFAQLVGLARTCLGSINRAPADEEDVALSAFVSLCEGAVQDRFPRLSDRDNLWALLVVITTRKATDAVRFERRAKRGSGKVRHADTDGLREQIGERLELVLSREPAPEFALQLAEECQHLLSGLDEELKRLILGKLNGLTNLELAAELGCAQRTVERRLALVRQIWNASLLGE